MLPATQMQKRAVAIATTLILLCVGFLANRHEAEVAHVREQSGRIVHAQELAEHHEISTNAHLHGREVHEHAGDCSLLALAHERLTTTPIVLVTLPVAATTKVEIVPVHEARAVAGAYRYAPKTSPPVTA